MKKLLQISILALLAVFFGMIVMSYAATIAATSCSLTHVQAAVTAASRGDTVTVPACSSATWTDKLEITKAITLQGAGIGVTTIKSNQNIAVSPTYVDCSQGTYRQLIHFRSVDAAADASEVMRITGFTFDADEKSGIIMFHNTSTTYIKARIDNNEFKNLIECVTCSSTDTDWIYQTIYTRGLFYGVVDNNTFSGAPYLIFLGTRRDEKTTDLYTPAECDRFGFWNWENETFTYGDGKGWYIEDNKFTVTETQSFQNINIGWGQRGVIRYNTFIATTVADAGIGGVNGHNALGGIFGSSLIEVYGNYFVEASTTSWFYRDLLQARGGKNMAFWNRSLASGTGQQMQVEIQNMSKPPYCATRTTHTCPAGSISSGAYCATDGMQQEPSSVYLWNNRYGTAGTTQAKYLPYNKSLEECSSGTASTKPRENVDYWLHNTSFTGASGMGCGTLANRPATCTTGTAYWATDQSCSSVDASYIGAATPTGARVVANQIVGTLYRCYPTNVWTAYYTPYSYPHPLRGEPDPPDDLTISDMSPVIEQSCTDASDPYTMDIAISMNTNKDATCKFGWNNPTYCTDVTQTDANTLCEVPDGTADGMNTWTVQRAQRYPDDVPLAGNVVSFETACDDTEALGCSDIDMTDCIRVTKAQYAKDEDVYTFKKISDTDITGDIYVQFYFKNMDQPHDGTGCDWVGDEEDGIWTCTGETDMTDGHDVEILGFTPGKKTTYDPLPGDYPANVYMGLQQRGGNLTVSAFHYITHNHEIAGTTDVDNDGSEWIGVRLHIYNSATAGADYYEWWADWGNNGTWTKIGDSRVAYYDHSTSTTINDAITFSHPFRYLYIGQNDLEGRVDFQITGIKVSTSAMPDDCRRATYSTGTAYAALPYTMSGTAQSHTATVEGIACGDTTTIFYACQDTVPYTSDTGSWSFGVADVAGATPIISSLTVKSQACAVTNRLVVGTQNASTCRYCVNGVGGCSNATAWADRTQMTVTGGDTVHHEVMISQACSSSVVYNVLCQDTQAVESANLAITVTSDAAKTLSLTGGTKTLGIGSGTMSVTVIP